MTYRLTKLLLSILIVSLVGAPTALAEEGDESHPLLSNRFFISAGAFLPDKNFKITARGSAEGLGRTIDFDEVFKVDDSETTGAAEFRWRFGKKWQLQGQYWKVSDSGSTVLDRDVEWKDVILEAGTGASAGVGIDVARIFLGRKFNTGDRSELGLGLGIHWLELSAFVSGQILSNIGDIELYDDKVSASAPLPNLGAWYVQALSPKWALTAHFDWLSVNYDVYSGSIVNAQAGVNWSITQHFGAKATWNYFKLNADVDKRGWYGKAEVAQNGPFISLYATW